MLAAIDATGTTAAATPVDGERRHGRRAAAAAAATSAALAATATAAGGQRLRPKECSLLAGPPDGSEPGQCHHPAQRAWPHCRLHERPAAGRTAGSYGASYAAGVFNPNVNFSRAGIEPELRLQPAALGADSPALTEAAAAEYRNNLRPGLSQRIALLATRHLARPLVAEHRRRVHPGHGTVGVVRRLCGRAAARPGPGQHQPPAAHHQFPLPAWPAFRWKCATTTP